MTPAEQMTASMYRAIDEVHTRKGLGKWPVQMKADQKQLQKRYVSSAEAEALPEDTIGQRLRKARFRAGVSQTELDERCGRNGMIGHYEKDRQVPAPYMLLMLTRELGVTAEWIMEGR